MSRSTCPSRYPLATLAGLARLSTYYFCRAFKQSFGVPPHRYHTSRRIEQAKVMLAARKHSVTEIGLTLGFERHELLHGSVPEDHRQDAEFLSTQPPMRARFRDCVFHEEALSAALQTEV